MMKIEYETKNRKLRYVFVESFCYNTLSHKTMYMPKFNEIIANHFEFVYLYLERGTYQNSKLIECIFDNVLCYKMLFCRTAFKNCKFIGTQFENCHFIECQFIDCDFTGINKNINNIFVNCNIYNLDNKSYFSLQGRNQVHSLSYLDKNNKDIVIHLDYIGTHQYEDNSLKIIENHKFYNMYLHRISFVYLYLRYFDFYNSNIRGAIFDSSIIENCIFDAVFFCSVTAYYTVFRNCSFKETRFVGNRFVNCQFIDCDFTNATQPIPKDSKFENCNIDDFPILNNSLF